MPKSKVRKKPAYNAGVVNPVGGATGKQIRPSPPWYPILMVALMVIGLAYIVVYYIAGDRVPLMRDLSSWNFAVGFGFLIVGLGLAVRWR